MSVTDLQGVTRVPLGAGGLRNSPLCFEPRTCEPDVHYTDCLHNIINLECFVSSYDLVDWECSQVTITAGEEQKKKSALF